MPPVTLIPARAASRCLPSAQTFEFDLKSVDEKFWNTATRLSKAKEEDSVVRVRRKGFPLRLAMSFTDFM